MNAAVVELCVVNAIKYSDPNKHIRWVRIAGEIGNADIARHAEVKVTVEDNGIRIPCRVAAPVIRAVLPSAYRNRSGDRGNRTRSLPCA